MKLHFELLGVLQRLAGAEGFVMEAHGPLSVEQALERLAARLPAIAPELQRCAVARGDALIKRRDLIEADATLALLPPVAGG